MVTARNFLDELLADLHRPGRYLPDHPFVTGVEQGTLTLDQLRGWAKETFPIFGTALRFLNVTPPGMDAIAHDREYKHLLWESMIEELYGAMSETAGHTELFLRFCGALGLTRKEVVAHRSGPEVSDLLRFTDRLRREVPLVVTQTVIGTGAESHVPETFRKIIHGLKTHYGLTDEQIEFFSVHIEADEEHGDVSARIVEKYVTTDELRRQTRELTGEFIDKFWAAWNVWQKY